MTKTDIRDYQWIKPDKEKCISCGKCAKYCPRDVLRMDDEGHPYMKYRDDCWYCDVCTYICPTEALHLEEIPYLIK